MLSIFRDDTESTVCTQDSACVFCLTSYLLAERCVEVGKAHAVRVGHLDDLFHSFLQFGTSTQRAYELKMT